LPPSSAPLVRSFLATAAAWLLLSAWALVVPPFQVPDEVQHAMRATSVLSDPWITAGDSFIVDQRHTNPMSRSPGPELGNLFFKSFNSLGAADVARMKRRRWDEYPPMPELRERWPGASYPPVYHWAVFAIAQPATDLLGLTPYQSLAAYRLSSVLLAGLLWGLVYGLLEAAVGWAAAVRGVGLLLGIPMLTFASVGINPDAAALPLSAAAIIAAWRLGETGERPLVAGLLLAAAAMAKPTGLPVIGAVIVSAGLAGMAGAFSRRRAVVLVATAGAALLAVHAVFYAWSPPRFLGGRGPVHASFAEWAATVPGRIPDLWMMYWGWLGWLDYRLSGAWYFWLLPVLAINAVVAAFWIARRRSAVFLPLVSAVLAAIMIAGEFVYLPQAGYNLQGRHFLVGAAGLLPLVTHRRRWAWAACLGYVAVLHLRLAWQTFGRYYARDAATLWSAWPFS
jgi:hypothetical protein